MYLELCLRQFVPLDSNAKQFPPLFVLLVLMLYVPVIIFLSGRDDFLSSFVEKELSSE